jgi:hypothetical protein
LQVVGQLTPINTEAESIIRTLERNDPDRATRLARRATDEEEVRAACLALRVLVRWINEEDEWGQGGMDGWRGRRIKSESNKNNMNIIESNKWRSRRDKINTQQKKQMRKIINKRGNRIT